MAAEDRSGFGGLLGKSLALLREEAPRHLGMIRQALGGTAIRITLGEEAPVFLRTAGGWPWVHHDETDFAVEAVLPQSALLAIVDGSLSIEDAILGDSLFVRGALDDVLRCHEALRAWLHGAIRCPNFTDLLEELKNHYRDPGQRRISRE